jgi:allantoinase
VHVEGGTIVSIRAHADVPAGAELVDRGDLVVAPGLVDSHVHVNEPGRTSWEGFDTATRAAAAGGVTTLVDMPLNSIPATTSVVALEAKRRAASGRCHVDVAFWGGIVPGNDHDVPELAAAGVRGFKCFLVPSGVAEFPEVDEDDLRRVLPAVAKTGLPLLVHAESPQMIVMGARPGQDPGRYAGYLATRPEAAEVAAVRLMIRLARETGARIHIVHVSAAGSVEEIARARADGVLVTAETCPHYLAFTAADVPDGGTAFKCAPPIRDASHREALWAGLSSGSLTMIASDHSPSPRELKCAGDFARAWGGIASMELMLAAVWTEARSRGFSPLDLVRWSSRETAQLAGLSDRKGSLSPGYDADIVVWDPDRTFTVRAVDLQQRHKITPYEGRALRGVVQTTFVRGVCVWDEGRVVQPSSGRLL